MPTAIRAGSFDAGFYDLYRPEYPVETFEPLLRSMPNHRPLDVVDVGCGTGHSLSSFHRAAKAHGYSMRATGVDPDPSMLECAKVRFPAADYRLGTAELIPAPDQSVDIVLVGSAFHWMKSDRAEAEFLRVLRPSGSVWIFEYQFPKALDDDDLNEWIRRQFNQKWRAPEQAPRGNFKQVTQVFRQKAAWTPIAEFSPKMIFNLSPSELLGLIRSQSRVLHYEQSLGPDERAQFSERLSTEVQSRMNRPSGTFDFRLSVCGFMRQT